MILSIKNEKPPFERRAVYYMKKRVITEEIRDESLKIAKSSALYNFNIGKVCNSFATKNAFIVTDCNKAILCIIFSDIFSKYFSKS